MNDLDSVWIVTYEPSPHEPTQIRGVFRTRSAAKRHVDSRAHKEDYDFDQYQLGWGSGETEHQWKTTQRRMRREAQDRFRNLSPEARAQLEKARDDYHAAINELLWGNAITT